MNSINGKAIVISSLDLAKYQLNWPPYSQHPPESKIKEAAHELISLLRNPPDGFEVHEATGRYYSIKIGRVRE